MTTDEFLTTEEVADIMRVKPATVRDWLRRGLLRGVSIQRSWRIPRSELERFVQSRYGAPEG
jgi:excisionase family DNA binding protein